MEQKSFSTFFKAHYLKVLLLSFSITVFTFLLFPFDDLGDLVTSQVYDKSNKRIYVQFDRLHLSLFPESGIALDEVYLEATGVPALKAKELVFTPSLSSLMSSKPAGSVALKGFLQGNIEASLKPAGKSENGVIRDRITLSAKQISLSEIREMAQLPVMLKGSINLDSTATADLTFQEQPDMDLTLKIDKFELPPSNVQTPMGPITLPDLKLSSVELKGRLSSGRFQIEEGLIGKDQDEIRGTIKGGIAMTIKQQGGVIYPVIGGYDFNVDLNIKKSFQDRAALFLSFIDQHKTNTADGARYAFKLNATSSSVPPSINPLR